jgi:SCP-2 sterol transfer family protein
MRRLALFFFMHIGSFLAVLVYIVVGGRAGYTPDGVRHALDVALVVMTAYVALAWSQGESKQFDASLWVLFAVGVLAAHADIRPLFALYVRYFGVLLFGTLALTALVPLILGRETFTYYFARRQIPPWQVKLPGFHAVNRVITAWWAVLFCSAAALCAAAPLDWRFTLLYPNLLIFGLGMTSSVWLPLLYFRLFPPALPGAIEPLIMAMPFVFDRRAAAGRQASIQFVVSGAEPGEYHLRIAGKRCESFLGRADAPDLTIHTPDVVWMRIVRGELDGERALASGLYRAEGDLTILPKLGDWFPRRR